MPTLLIDSGVLQVKVRYLWQKGKGDNKSPYYYRRRYPKDIAEIFFNRGEEVGTYYTQALRTHDLQLAGKWVAQINRKVEEEWFQLRQGLTVDTARKAAEQLLADYGLDAVAMEQQRDNGEAEELFIEKLSRKVPDDAHPKEALPDFEYRALQILKGEYEHRLSDAKEYYLSQREQTRKLVNTTNGAFKMVFDVLGDRPLRQYKRRDVAEVIRQALAKGLKTATVDRRLHTVRAAVNDLIRDYELEDSRNPFKEYKIPKKGEDAEKRGTLNCEQVQKLREFVHRDDHKNNTSANLLGLMLDTGARVAEVTGLARGDVVLDAPVPYVHIRPNPLRRLKNKESVRTIPLVGDALFAAQRAMAENGTSQYLFPRYMPESGCKNDNASAAVNKLLAARGCKTCHWLRHTMRTRLRNANVSLDRVKEILGWTGRTMADHYGEGTALEWLHADLLKTL